LAASFTMSYLEKLIGKTIVNIQISENTYYPLNKGNPQIVQELLLDFGDYILTIGNPYSLEHFEHINSLLNTIVKDIRETETEAILITTTDQKFTIDLREESYVGPEAMSLVGPNNLCVVWN
jgi:hypothetical protein